MKEKGVVSALISSYSGMLSKLLASFSVYPINVIRTRIQQNQYIESYKLTKYRGIIDCVSKTYHMEGVSGFYKGFLTSSLRTLPANGIFFFFFEFFKDKLLI